MEHKTVASIQLLLNFISFALGIHSVTWFCDANAATL